MDSNRIPIFSLRLCFAFFITTLVSGRTSAQIINSWDNPSSANWESANWSLGILPASNQSVFITNSGYKAVGIFPQTPVTFPNSMTVSNLTVSGPADGLDTLLLNYAGTAVPLHVRHDLAIGTNGTVLNFYTGLQVDHNLALTGGQFAQEGGITTATNGSASVSFGTFNLTNASAAFGQLSLTGSTANQSGGTTACNVMSLWASTFNFLSGRITGAVNANSGTFVQSGGTNQSSVNLGWSTNNNGFGYNGGFGNYLMQGGRLEAAAIGAGVAGPLARGDFNQSGGIVNAGTITLGGSTFFNNYSLSGSYELTNGSLICGSLAIVNGGVSQSGGSLLLNSALSLFGVFNDYGPPQFASYTLGAGTFTNQGISMGLLGYFQQNGGTNQVAGTLEFRDTSYELSGGMLGTSNTVIWHAGFVTSDNVHAVSQFDHRGGAHKVSNVLSNFQDYNFYGGTLTAGGIYLRGAMNFYAGAPTATLSNTGILDLGGTLNFLTNATQNPGPVRLSANSRIYFFPGATLQFASSSGLVWSNGVHLSITNWHGSATGGGADQIRFGSSATGLTASQLAQVQFEDPPSLPPGNYQAQILPTGEIVPTGHLTVAGWGPDYYDTSRAPGGLSGVTAIASGFYTSAAILTNGSLISWGEPTDNYYSRQQMFPDGLTNVAAIAIGDELSLALLRDGTVIGSVGAYGDTAPPPGLSNVVGIAAGRDQGVAVKDDGTVISWGYDGYGETNVPPGLSNVTGVAAGRLFGAALKRDGTVVAWGNSYNGVTNIPPGLSNVISISAEEDHGLALLANGTVVGWGDRTNLPLGISNVVSIAAGAGFDLALKSDGTVLSWYDYSTLTNVAPYLTNVVAIAVGNGPGLAILGTDYPQPFRLNPPHRLADGTAAFGLQGQLGQHYVIQQSSNLLDWTFNQNAAGGSRVVSITDPTAPPLGRRFYRALRVP